MSEPMRASEKEPQPAVERRTSETTRRVLTALVLAPLLLAAAWAGGWVFGLAVMAAALAAQYEVYGLMRAGGTPPAVAPGLALGALVFWQLFYPGLLALVVALIVLLIVVSPFVVPERGGLPNLAGTVFGAFYPTFLLAFLPALRESEGLLVGDLEAFWLVLATLFLIWATDIGAYYVGRAIGKHPLAPSISPKKTWEGAVGGAACAVAVAVALRLVVLDFLPWGHLVVVALICGAASQLGDLAESRMKRLAGVKDSGRLLPGHGGVLDRLDAAVVAVPLVYLYLADVAGVVDGLP